MSRILLVLGFVLALASATQDQPVLWLEGPVRIGDDKQKLVWQLAKHYDLQHVPIDGVETLALFDKGTETPRGQVTFANGRLSFATRDWRHTTDEDAVAFARSLVAAANRLEDEGFTSCQLETKSIEEPTILHRELRLRCGGKWLRVSVYKVAGDADQAMIAEELPGPKAKTWRTP